MQNTQTGGPTSGRAPGHIRNQLLLLMEERTTGEVREPPAPGDIAPRHRSRGTPFAVLVIVVGSLLAFMIALGAIASIGAQPAGASAVTVVVADPNDDKFLTEIRDPDGWFYSSLADPTVRNSSDAQLIAAGRKVADEYARNYDAMMATGVYPASVLAAAPGQDPFFVLDAVWIYVYDGATMDQWGKPGEGPPEPVTPDVSEDSQWDRDQREYADPCVSDPYGLRCDPDGSKQQGEDDANPDCAPDFSGVKPGDPMPTATRCS